MKLLVLAIMATLTLAVGALRPIPTDNFECQAQGYFAKPGNCKFLYKCKSIGEQEFTKTLHRCPDQYLFDHQKNKCIKHGTKGITCTWGNYATEDFRGQDMMKEAEIEAFFNEIKPIKVNGYVAKPGNCKYYFKWEWSDNKPNKISFLEMFKCPGETGFSMYDVRCRQGQQCPNTDHVVAEAPEGTTDLLTTTIADGMESEKFKVFVKAGNCKLFYAWRGIKGTDGKSDRLDLELKQCPKGYRFIELKGKCLREGQDGYEDCDINLQDDHSGSELLNEDDEFVQKD